MISTKLTNAKFVSGRLLIAMQVAVLLPANAFAVVTSFGQTWNPAPDAWARDNDADTSHFGWDALENSGVGIPMAGGAVLDDSTVDLGGIIVTTATGTRLFQGTDGIANPSPTTWGHRSGSGNFYSGPASGAHDSVAGVAPASGVEGFTTVVLQLIGSFQPSAGLNFNIDQSLNAWTLQKSLFGLNENGSGLYWQEYTAMGDNLPFKITFTSTATSIALDAVQVDTFWSLAGPVVNARTAIPEPVSLALLATGMVGCAVTRRHRAG